VSVARTFGRGHVEGHRLGPGAVSRQRGGAHASRVVPGAQVAEARAAVLAELLARHTLVFLGLKETSRKPGQRPARVQHGVSVRTQGPLITISPS